MSQIDGQTDNRWKTAKQQTLSKWTLMEPTRVAPTAVKEKNPYCQLPTYITRSLKLNRPCNQRTTPGFTQNSSPTNRTHSKYTRNLYDTTLIRYCLEDKREDYQNCSVLYCVSQLYTVISTHIWAVLTGVLATRHCVISKVLVKGFLCVLLI